MSVREKKYLNILTVCLVAILLTCLCFGIAMNLGIDVAVENKIRYISVIVIIISYIVLFLYGIIWLIHIWKRSVHNIQKCDDKDFDDLSKICGIANDNISYDIAYKLIDYYYKDGGIIDDLISTKQYYRLLNRYDFLKKNIEFDEELSQYLYSIFLSLFTTEMSKIMEAAYVISDFWGVLLFLIKMMILVLMIVFFFLQRYAKRGKNGEFNYALMEYEEKLLKERIESSVNSTEMSKKDYKVLMMQQLLIHKILIKDAKKLKKYKLEERKQDINEIKSLKLYLKKYKKYKMKECVLDDIVIHFYYVEGDIDNEKVYKLVNENYRKLYILVKKYYDIKIKDTIPVSEWEDK